MTESEVIKLLTMIAAAYPNMKAVTKLQVKIWHESLKDIPVKVALANAKKHIMTNQYPPTIAEILGTNKNNANKFHNFSQYSSRFTSEQIEDVCRKKRERHYFKLEEKRKALKSSD